jgi:hypothetical protein
MNLLAALVGGTQSRLPKRNFARFLLILFLLFSIVIRTLYQGSFYQLLNSNQQKEPVKSLEEMMSKGFNFYSFKGFGDLLLSWKNLQNK